MLALAAVGSACAPAPSGRPASPPPSVVVSPGPVVSSSPAAASPQASAAASPTAGVPIDAALLELLPVRLDGLDRQPQPDVDTELSGDAGLAKVASSFATALYIDPATSDFAYAAVVRLSDDLGDEAYRDWRDTFDEAACRQAGGVVGNAEAKIGGHDAFIGTCAGGVRTYHTLVDDGSVLVSISALGEERKLGEQLVSSLPS